MTFVESWEAFYAEAEKLYLEHPDHTRFVTKYRHVDGKVELKVTNDRVCLKFVTDQQQDLKRIEKLNNLFLTYMCGKDPYADPSEPVSTPGRPGSGGDATTPVGDAGNSASKGKKKTKR